uniref:tRNA-t(6)A37 methylthiotransferase n=1 Tax=uncultured korarchaeote TaxID=161241 RepID=A0A1L2JMD9_9CREN|nr:2-methylthioadenine synthetase [uncultured korarchaeote]
MQNGLNKITGMDAVKYYIISFGCAMNKADGMIMEGILLKSGFAKVKSPEEADVIILNTCNVKGPTESRMVHYARKLSSTGKPLVVTGCMAVTQKNLLKRYSKVFLGPRAIDKIVNACSYALRGIEFSCYHGEPIKTCLPTPQYTGITAIVPVEEGCLGSCTYCITRFARGKLKSYPLNSIIERIKLYIRKGAKEIFLTGQDISAYGKDIGLTIIDLLEAVTRIEGSFRVRVGMLNPLHVVDRVEELVKVYRDEKIYKFFHIPVQSGSDKILSLMGRNYSVKDFLKIIETVRKAYPYGTLSTDVIVGFPSETEQDFMDTVKLIETVKPEIVNISRFSPRPGTKAANMEQLPKHIVKNRSRRLTEISRRIKYKRNKQLLGKEFAALVVKNIGSWFMARTDVYRPVIISKAKLGAFIRVKVVDATSRGLIGVVLNNISSR